MTATRERSVRLAGRDLPVVLPSRRDPRLHTAGVIISLHVIGVTALGFKVSVPQILAAMLTAGVIDFILTLRRTGALVWPASGLLTGSGVGLILRLTGMGPGEYWSWEGWYWFALVAGVSVLTKFVIRVRGRHLFNPSNVGLVAAFLVVGADVLEPLDFWWAPFGFWMALAYAVIIGGGIAITRSLRLLEMATVFWLTLIAGLGVLAVSGHCMIATWSPAPVCDGRFWATLATSPEVLVFMFFMITDPKTIPDGRSARIAFAATLGAFTSLMIAPHSLEYGAKVGLLGSLVLWSALRGLFDNAYPATTDEESGLRVLLSRFTRPASPVVSFARGVGIGSALVAVAAGIVIAGDLSQEPALASTVPERAVSVEVDASQLPAVVVDRSLERLAMDIDDAEAAALATMLTENLILEGEAIRYVDSSRLALADGGQRLVDMQARLEEAVITNSRPVDHYTFDTLLLRLAAESKAQVSAALAFEATGSVERVTYDASGGELSRSSSPLHMLFVMRQLAGDRWLIVEAIDD